MAQKAEYTKYTVGRGTIQHDEAHEEKCRAILSRHTHTCVFIIFVFLRKWKQEEQNFLRQRKKNKEKKIEKIHIKNPFHQHTRALKREKSKSIVKLHSSRDAAR